MNASNKKKSLFRDARLRQLADIILKEQRVSTTSLAERLGVTTATVRSDLAALEESGLIQRGWGGAMVLEDSLKHRGPGGSVNAAAPAPVITHDLAFGVDFRERLSTRQLAKQAIGKAAAELVQDDATIMIDAGTTTRCVLLNLANHHRLNIVTNAAELLQPLVESSTLELICTGGVLRRPSLGYVGELTEHAIQCFKASKAIIGMDGISLDFGLTTPNEAEARVKRAMLDSSKEVIVVADSSKLERVSLMPVAAASAITHLVTDDQASPEIIYKLRQLGVNVILVPLNLSVGAEMATGVSSIDTMKTP